MAERKWTRAQLDAIEADCGTVLVSAAAGSGKTSVLTERIVRKLIREKNPVSPDSLLVVTFTNAAAAEMRSRIYAGIAAAVTKYPERRKEFVSLLAVAGEMQVCTMDSFCMSLVKENCHTLGIDADFTILEQGETAQLKRKAAVSVIERRFAENAEAFLPLARMFESGKNDSRLIDTVIRLSDFSMSEPEPERWLQELHGMFSADDIRDSVWAQYLEKEVCDDLDYCLTLSEAAISHILTDEELADKYLKGFETENEFLQDIKERIEKASWDEKISLIGELYNYFFNISKLPRAPKGYTDNPVKMSAHKKRDEIKEVIKAVTEYMSITESENQQDMPVLRLVSKELTDTVIEYNRELLSAKKEMSAYDFSDISHFALSLLYDSSAKDKKTALARELTERYSEILIDEYQDTNRAQDTLFSSISRDGKNMFFVGDVKQSIYRFRLASPEIFIEKCNEFPYYDGKTEKSKIILGHNFRSRKGILDGVNFIFSRLMSTQCGDIDYNDDEKLNFPEGMTATDTTDVELTVIDCSDEKADITEARYIAGIIKKYLDGGATVTENGRERPAQPSDFCVLMRSPSGSAVKFIKELEELDIPVSAQVSIKFFETPEIKTVMSCLRVLDNPARDTDMLAIMLSPLFGFTVDETAEIRVRWGGKMSLFACASRAAENGNEKCKSFLARLEYFRRLSACASVGTVLRQLYDETSYLFVAGAMKDGENRKKNLRKLLEKAQQMPENASTVGSFVRYMDVLRENGADLSGAVSSGGVQIMSMHKSKGLEFPFVFIAGTSKRFNKTDLTAPLIINHNAGLGIRLSEPENIKKYDTLSSIALKKINNNELLSEELRVYYVALTRAKQKLHIVTGLKNMEKSLDKMKNVLDAMDFIPPYFIKHSSTASKWLIAALMRHPDAVRLRNPRQENAVGGKKIKVELFDGIAFENIIVSAEKTAFSDAETVEEIRKRAAFIYKFQAVASCRSKHTASSLREEYFDPAGFGKSVPAFMFSGEMSPADVGTATHRFLQYCDFDRCKKSVSDECRRLTENGRLSEKQANAVDATAIEHFLNSEIFRRAEDSKGIFREKQFTMAKSVCELDGNLPEGFGDEKTVIIGKIDLLFIEDDGAVIVDYKTDNVSDITLLKDRYYSQMQLYSEALKKSMDVSVKECILYSLKLKDSISLKF